MDSPNASGSGSNAESYEGSQYDEDRQNEADMALEGEGEDESVEDRAVESAELVALLELIMETTTLYGMLPDDWNSSAHQTIYEWLKDSEQPILLIYYDSLKLMSSFQVPEIPIHDLMYFLRISGCNEPLTVANFFDNVMCGSLNGNMEGSILNILQDMYTPAFFENKSWPEGVKGSLFSKLHEFLCHLTDLHYKMFGLTILYIPQEGISLTIDAASRQKELVRRLEGVLMFWSRQLRVAVSDICENSSATLLTPVDEYNFWQYRWESLTLLSSQLENSHVKHISDILTLAQSSYLVQFRTLCEEMNDSLEEAISNIDYLQLLEKPCMAMWEEKEIENILHHVPHILNLIRLIWTKSPYYTATFRLILLCRNLSNQVILQCRNSVDLDAVFDEGKTRECIATLNIAIFCCRKFKAIYSAVTEAHTAYNPDLPWNLDESLVFGNIDSFIQRCLDLIEICEAMITFGRIEENPREKPLFLGTSGGAQARVIEKVEERFLIALSEISKVRNHILDVLIPDWPDEVLKFRTELRQLEQIIQNLMTTCLTQSGSVVATLLVMYTFNPYAQRSAIKRLFDYRIEDLWNRLLKEVLVVQHQLLQTVPARQANSPVLAGVAVTLYLHRQMLLQYKRWFTNAVWLDLSTGGEIMSQLDYLVSRIDLFIKGKHIKWNDGMEDNVVGRLERPVICRSPTRPGLIEPNMDPFVFETIHECTFWILIDRPIPHPAEQLSKAWVKVRILYETILDLVRQYNRIITPLSDEERLLFKEVVNKLDRKISPGLHRLYWTMEKPEEFLDHWTRKNVQLFGLVEDYKQAMAAMSVLTQKISATKLVYIPVGVVYELPQLEAYMEEYRNNALINIIELYQGILQHVTAIYEGFEEDIPAMGYYWHSFVLKLDSLLEAAILVAVKNSMHDFLEVLCREAALIKLSISLKNSKVIFNPTLKKMISIGRHLILEMVSSFKVMPRIYDKMELKGYGVGAIADAIVQDSSCRAIQKDINKEVIRNMMGIQEYLKVWEPYQPVWEVDLNSVVASYEFKNPINVPWDLDLTSCDDVAAAAFREDNLMTVNFTRIDSGAIRISISHLCAHWKERLCNVLLNITDNAMDDIFQRIDNNCAALREEPKNLQALSPAMSRYEFISSASSTISNKFPQIEHQFEILLKHDVYIPQSIQLKRLNIPRRWDDYLEALQKAKEMLERCKENFKTSLLEKAENFKVIINDLAQSFEKNGPFHSRWQVKVALKYLAEISFEAAKINRQEEDLRTDLSLFDISHPSNPVLQQLSLDLEVLESAWLVLEDWDITWSKYRFGNFWKLDTDAMEDKTLDLFRRLVRMGAELKERGWHIVDLAVFQIESARKCIPLITELRNPSLRARHWKQIQDLIRKEFDAHSPQFTFGAVMEMRLHEFGLEIFEISRTATLELSIENGLKNINDSWAVLEVPVEPYKDMKNIYRIKAIDDITQSIEEHMAALASMKGTKFVEPFLKEVEYWEKSISAVDEGLELMLTVQRQWIYLENIFTGEDIRQQLPEETIIFEQLTSMWRTISSRVQEQANAIAIFHHPGLFKTLSGMLELLEDIQKALAAFLENKRYAFPRFYFISNDDLLEILGNSKKPELIQPHLKKLFDNIAKLTIIKSEAHNRQEATAMISGDGEVIELSDKVICEGAVEHWLSEIEASMRVTLRFQLRSTKDALRKMLNKRDKWLKDWPGQMCITSSQIHWTTDVTRTLMACHYLKSKVPLKKQKRKQKKILRTLSDMLRSGIPKMLRLKVVALITIEIHARDVVEGLYKVSCTDAGAFEWMSQLRFYWEKAKDDCIIRQTNTCFDYGYEYLGNSGRLAITPLTDRCYITLTNALHMHRGGSPKGPAGTGKTETVKDLGKALAAYVIVFNCSEGLDYRSMGRLFSGLAQTGAWGCFDEFNRINVEVLSVVAQQILSILSALAAGLHRFKFEGAEINLVHTCGIFITMNPGYAGRTELPDNLKAMFRPISMIVPDSALIAEVTLYGEGFHDSKSLANKVNTLFNLSKQQLSKQDHYEFGLRGMVSLLRYAGIKRRALPLLTDAEVTLLAMREMNIAKLTSSDLGLFNAITKDLFPGIDPPVVDMSLFRNAVAAEMKKAKLQPVPTMINKVIQLYETQSSRHSVMLVGNTCTGKSETWKMLKATLGTLSITESAYYPVIEYPLNPKVLTLGELFGEVDLSTGEWLDGVVSSIMRKVCAEETPERKWVLFDGPVDAVWIENMNSAMDDNKLLTLINSERISMPEQVSFLFEVENLRVASPATVSRAGMVYTDYSDLTWRPYVASWLESLSNAAIVKELSELFERSLSRSLAYKKNNCKELISLHELALVRNLCSLLEFICVKNLNDASPELIPSLTKLYFLFCMTWSVFAVFDIESRAKIDVFVRESESVYPLKNTIYEYYVDQKLRSMCHWENKLDEHWVFGPNLPFHEIMVPTVDTVRYEYLVSTWLDNSHPLLLVGPVGVGKTCVIQRHLLHRKESRLCGALSASTSATALQQLLESRLEKRTKGVFGPSGGRKLIIFLDDFNMPAADVYGSQPPLELMRQWLDYGFWYDRQKQWKKIIRDINISGAMGPPGGGRNQIPNRLLSWFGVFALTFPDESQVIRIFYTMIRQHLSTFDEEVKGIAENLTLMTVNLFSAMVECMLPTPKKTHYLFNLRDISRVFQGLLRSTKGSQTTSKELLILWLHEINRVFCDRLVDDNDRDLFMAKVDLLLGNYLDTTLTAVCPEKRPPVFGDFMNALGNYEELGNTLRSKLETVLHEYNLKPGQMPLKLVLFRDAMEHVCRIARVVSQPWGHILLVGIGGSGRSSLARLALHLCSLRTFSIAIARNYRVPEFREDLKLLYRQTGVDGRATGFIFGDNQVVTEEFLEIINSILGTGEVPNLYRSDELDEIRSALSEVASKAGYMLTSENVLAYLIDRSRTNLHVILCMNYIGDEFRLRLMRYPALVSCTTIDWFLPWPQPALVEVANFTLAPYSFVDTIFPQKEVLKEESKDSYIRLIISNIFASMHTSLEEVANEMWREMKRMCYVTPTIFLHLIFTYISLLNEKRGTLRTQAAKLKGGLHKIEEARESVEVMAIELEKAQEKVAVIQAQCEAAMIIMDEKRNDADEKAKEVTIESEKIAEEETQCRALAQAAQDDLDEAMPALEEAMTALESLSKKDISELKSYGRPPPKVMMVMEAVCILKGVTPDWAESKRILGEQDFLRSLKEFDKDHISEKTMKKISTYTSLSDFTPEAVESVSLAAKSLVMWVIATENYGKLWRIVGPKKARLDEVMNSLRKKQEEVAKLNAQLYDLNQVVKELNDEFQEKNILMASLKKEADHLQLKMERADMLVDGLSDEKIRWETTVIDLEENFTNLVGDCLVASAFLSYAGPFVSNYRTKLMQMWEQIVSEETELQRTPSLKVLEFLCDPAQIRDWGDIGLPMDDFSIENGILVTSGSRSPLVIDPQIQANKWIKNMERENGLVVMDEETPDMMRIMEQCITKGTPVLIQNVLEKIEPALMPVLGKAVTVQGNQTVLKLGEKFIQYHKDFRLFVTTKLSNPLFSTEVSTKTTLVNFLVKQEGLEAQLLGLVVRRERPELEIMKTKTLQTISNGRKTLLNLENELLRLLYESEGSLLENEELFTTLQESRLITRNIKEGIQTAQVTEVEIEEARAEYIPCAVRAAILFVCLNDLNLVDPMYQFSLDSYLYLYSQSLEKSPRNHVLSIRIKNINDYHTHAVFKNACCVLFARHKLLFAFYMCIKIMSNADDRVRILYEQLVRGGVVLKRENQPPNPAPSWLSQNAWDCIIDLETHVENIVASFGKDTESWKNWYLSRNPESTPLFGDFKDMDELTRLLLIRALREDRLTVALTSFVKNNLGQPFIEPPIFDLKLIFEESTSVIPLIFILSPGVDPTASLLTFAATKGKLDTLLTLSLGQGQAEIATRSIEKGVRDGCWVFLANCHLSLSWMPALDKIVEHLRSRSDVHANFRLWLSSSPHKDFPISILQDGIKMTTEPPQGLKGNLTRLYNTVSATQFMKCRQRDFYPKLLFSLAFFHAVLLERKKFEQLGWNVTYPFNDSDFEVSENLLGMYLDEYEYVPWDALKYLIAEVNYGGHVTDGFDRRLLLTYSSQYICPEALSERIFRLSSLPTYTAPQKNTLESALAHIAKFPVSDAPEAFGQHANAEINYFIMEAKTMCDTLLSMQSQSSAEGSGSMEEKAAAVAEDILAQLPETMNLETTERNLSPSGVLGPLDVVLLQEGARYNRLLSAVEKSLKDVKKAIAGYILMSPQLEEIFVCLFNGKVPPSWLNAYSSLKPLGSWTRDLVKRMDMLHQWANTARPPLVFWPAAFTFPTAFLTAVLQQAARFSGVSVDLLTWEFTPMEDYNEKLSEPPTEGVLCQGLYLEGAGWDSVQSCLCEPLPMKLICGMPVIWFKPTEELKKPKGLYNCPAYYFPVRAGSYIVTVDLASGKHPPETWIKRGTAILLSIAE